MYADLFAGLEEADSDDEITFTVFTGFVTQFQTFSGTGDFYSSGNYFGKEELEKL